LLWYEKAAQQRHLGALTVLTQLSFRPETTDEQRQRIFALWLALANAGNAQAQHVVGDFYLRGVGTGPSRDDAVKWFRLAIEQGSVGAELSLGLMLLGTDNADGEFAEATKLLTHAAAAGNAEAQYALGVVYGTGLGTKPNRKKAREFYQKAANQGHASALLVLADMVHEKARTDRERAEAIRLYTAAAEKGVPTAIYNLGLAYERGHGVPADIAKALDHYRRAAGAGFPAAREALVRLETVAGTTAPA
jgi:TPR repeat protein